jgi:quinol monooxygenase YgiN
MSQPIVLISHSTVKDGKLEALKDYLREGVEQLEADKPGTLVFLPYLNDDGTELTIVHVFADAEGMDAHMEGVQERAAAAYEFIQSVGYEIYGTPSDSILESMRGFSASTSWHG